MGRLFFQGGGCRGFVLCLSAMTALAYLAVKFFFVILLFFRWVCSQCSQGGSTEAQEASCNVARRLHHS